MAETRPNLLILCSDEHRRDCLGAMGHPHVLTPHLDALAKRGTLFTKAYSPSPICVPVRAAIATGQYIHQTGHWDSASPYVGTPRSWMHDMRDAGYTTASFGKLHFRSAENDCGFAEQHLPMHVVGGVGWTVGLIRDELPDYDATSDLAEAVGPGESEYTHFDRATTAKAVDWLQYRNQSDVPWAAFVSLVSPHYPLTAPEDFYALYDPQDMDLPIGQSADQMPYQTASHPELERLKEFYNYADHFDEAQTRKAKAAYYGLCSFMDDCFGQVLAALDATGQRDNTIVIYMSDHGDMMGDHGFWTKSVMYEGSAGVPLILAGPDVERASTCATPASLLDVAATARAVLFDTSGNESCGNEYPGTSLQTLAQALDDPDRVVFSEYHDGGSTMGQFMVRWGDWKYVHFARARAQLFNLVDDPCELTDLLMTSPQDAAVQTAAALGLKHLLAICDPSQIDQRCFEEQARHIEALGGREACLATAFGHTPAPKS